jgi:hypothetical protein
MNYHETIRNVSEQITRKGNDEINGTGKQMQKGNFK